MTSASSLGIVTPLFDPFEDPAEPLNNYSIFSGDLKLPVEVYECGEGTASFSPKDCDPSLDLHLLEYSENLTCVCLCVREGVRD